MAHKASSAIGVRSPRRPSPPAARRRRTTGAERAGASGSRPRGRLRPCASHALFDQLLERTTRPRRSCRGAVTRRPRTTSPVLGSSAVTAAARSRNPASIPENAWKNATESVSTSEPTTLPMARNSGWVAVEMILNPPLVGSIISLNTLWSRKRDSTPGASRKSRALRLGGRVDHDEVETFVVVELMQHLGRHVLLRSAQRTGDVLVERVRQDAVDLIGTLRVSADQAVEGRRSVEHHRPQLAATCRASVPGTDARVRSVVVRRRAPRPVRARRRAAGPDRW